jgi:proline iminopeptidase
VFILPILTLIVLGKHDYAVPYTLWEKLIPERPNITYKLLENDSHNPQTEAPDHFDPVLIDWLFDRR